MPDSATGEGATDGAALGGGLAPIDTDGDGCGDGESEGLGLGRSRKPAQMSPFGVRAQIVWSAPARSGTTTSCEKVPPPPVVNEASGGSPESNRIVIVKLGSKAEPLTVMCESGGAAVGLMVI
jgi:hypothetical protein